MAVLRTDFSSSGDIFAPPLHPRRRLGTVSRPESFAAHWAEASPRIPSRRSCRTRCAKEHATAATPTVWGRTLEKHAAGLKLTRGGAGVREPILDSGRRLSSVWSSRPCLPVARVNVPIPTLPAPCTEIQHRMQAHATLRRSDRASREMDDHSCRSLQESTFGTIHFISVEVQSTGQEAGRREANWRTGVVVNVQGEPAVEAVHLAETIPSEAVRLRLIPTRSPSDTKGWSVAATRGASRSCP